MKISRQSEHYGGSDQALNHTLQTEAHRRVSESFSFGHLLDNPGIGRQGVDPKNVMADRARRISPGEYEYRGFVVTKNHDNPDEATWASWPVDDTGDPEDIGYHDTLSQARADIDSDYQMGVI